VHALRPVWPLDIFILPSQEGRPERPWPRLAKGCLRPGKRTLGFLKGSTDSVHYLERDEVNGLKLVRSNGLTASRELTSLSMSAASRSDAWASDGHD
jgi:hypothetical protein